MAGAPRANPEISRPRPRGALPYTRLPLDGAAAACYPGAVRYEPVLHVVLHQPEIPQNTGNVGRTCLAVGAKLWLVRPLGFRLDARNVRRAGLDYWEELDWEAVDDWETLSQRLPDGRRWFLSKTASRLYTGADYRVGDVLVFGSETQGLPRSWLREHPEASLRIPVRQPVRSLNLASSVAVVVFEALRQFQAAGVPW